MVVKTLMVFHALVASASVLYLFRFSKEEEPTVKSNHDFFIEIKRKFTRELAKKINELLNSSATSNIVIKGEDYRESPADTVDSEKFGNILDEYLQKENSSLINVHKFRETYKKYRQWSECASKFSLFLAVVELIMASVHLFFSNHLEASQNKVWLFSINGVAGFLVICGIIILFVKEKIRHRIVHIRDSEIGL